jgi:hypothetical protein
MNSPDESRSVFYIANLTVPPLTTLGAINNVSVLQQTIFIPSMAVSSCSNDHRISKQNQCLPVHTGCGRCLCVSLCVCVWVVVVSGVKSQ